MNAFDIGLFRLINDLSKSLTFLNPVMIFIAEYTIYLLLLLMLFLWFSKEDRIKTRIMLLCAGFSAILGTIMAKLVGKLHYHTQPFDMLDNVNQLVMKEVDNSFPSDHTTVFFAVCMFFFLYYRKPKGVYALILASSVGFSRIWVSVHYPLDVLVGALVGISAALILFNLVFKKRLLRPIVTKYTEFEESLFDKLFRT